MERRHESESTSKTTTHNPAAEYVASEAQQEFQKAMKSSFPVQRLRVLYNEDEIKEVAELTRKRIFQKFQPVIVTFRGRIMGELVTRIDSGIEKITEDLIKNNEHHKEKVNHLIQNMMDFLCEEYEGILEDQVSLNPGMGPSEQENIFEHKKTEVIKFFTEQGAHWNSEVVKEKVSKLEVELTRIQRVIEQKKSIGRDASSASTSTTSGSGSGAVPTAEEMKMAELEEEILETCADLSDCWNADVIRFDQVNEDGKQVHWEMLGCFLDTYIVSVYTYLQNALQEEEKIQFLHPEYQEIHDNIKQVLRMATTALALIDGRTLPAETESTVGQSTEKVRKPIAATNVNGAGALMWERAFEMDLRKCFPSQARSPQFAMDYKDYELRLSKILVKKTCKDIIRESTEWKVEGFSSKQKLQDVVKGMELALGVDSKSNEGAAKLFTERLFQTWKPFKLDCLEEESDAEGDPGTFPGRSHEDESGSSSEDFEENNESEAE